MFTLDRLRHADTSQFETVKRKLARWATDNMEALRIARPALPDALNDRAQDNWESLLAIADRVGGHWGKTARHAAMAISGIQDGLLAYDCAGTCLVRGNGQASRRTYRDNPDFILDDDTGRTFTHWLYS